MQTVKIKIEGCFDENWVEWLDGFQITHTPQNETILKGKVKDQAALYGTIAKLRDLGLKLISVNSRKPRIKPRHR